MIVATVTVTRYLDDDTAELQIDVEANDANDNPLDIVEALGMLTLAGDEMVRVWRDGPDEDDE